MRRAPTAPLTMAFHILSEAIQEGNEGRLRLGNDTAPHARQNRKPLLPVVVKITTLLLIPYAGFLACGIITAYLTTDSKALSTNMGCGLYVPASNSLQSQNALVGPFVFQGQLDSVQLAESCYHTTSRANGCSFFVQQSTPYTSSDGPCPFVDVMCPENVSSTARFSTGPTDAATVGIHAPQTLQLQRYTTCVPLNGNRRRNLHVYLQLGL